MSEIAARLSTSFESESLSLELRTSGSPKALSPSIRSHDAATSGLNIEKKIAEELATEKAKKESPRKLSPRKTVKSLTTVAKKEIPQKLIKQKINPPKSLLKRAAPNKVTKSPRSRTSSPKTSVKREIPNKLTKSLKRKKSPLSQRPVEKEEPPKDKQPKKETNSLNLGKSQRRQSLISSISKVKSIKSVISKDSSRQVSQRSTIRDDIFRNYPFDPSLRRTSLTSDVSVKTSTSLNKSEKKSTALKKGLWGPHKIRMLKPQPKEPELPKEIRVSVKAKAEESSETSEAESFDLTLSDAEAESPESPPESPVSEREVEVEEPPEDQRNIFLQIFGVLPDINELSARESLDIMKSSAPKAEVRFVPPVDMGSYESEGSETWASPEEEMGITRSVECYSSDITLDDLTESDEEPVKVPIVAEEPNVQDITVCLMNVRPRGTGEHMGFETSSTSSGYEVRLAIIEAIQAFLVGIINQTVEYAENPSLRLERHLDPAKMIEELTQLSVNYKDELQRNLNLDQVISEYFFRRKEFGFLCKTKEMDTVHASRLRTAIMELDCHLEREKETQRSSENLVAELTEQERIARSLEMEKVKEFEAKVRETLLRDGYDHLKHVTNDLLKKMNKVRDELSNSRREMTAVQHQLAFIRNKSEEMEDLGNGLRVQEYLSIQANTQSLSVKINERDIELQRLNDRMTYDIHAMAHLKNKEKMNQDLLRKMKDKLTAKEQRQKDLRELLYAGMLQHNCLKKKIKSLRHSGSLMHYPDTLRDYDATVEYLEAKRQVIQQLKAEHKRLERKISLVESGIASINLANKATASFHASTFRLSSKQYSKVRI